MQFGVMRDYIWLLAIILCRLSNVGALQRGVKASSKVRISVRRPLGTRGITTLLATDTDVPTYIKDLNKFVVTTVKDMLIYCYGDRTYARFYALETIARVPYFSYTSVLHLYETIGFFRQKEYIKLHFAESWNELHHLLVRNKLTAYM